MKNPLKIFEANTVGKDYVVGDMHGSYSAFQNLLNGIGFDKSVDRMFSVGDLIDRGPDSVACLSLLREPWFHAVLANHEKMMIDKFNQDTDGMGYYWFRNGGDWGIEAYNDYKAVFIDHSKDRIPFDASVRIIDLLKDIEDLPFLITVNTKSGKKFHILHAELPTGAGLQITDEVLSDPSTVYDLASRQRGDGESFLWFRYLFNSLYCANLQNKKEIIRQLAWVKTDIFNDNLSHIISGHTIVQKPVTFIGQTNIDTGAFDSYWTPIEPYGAGRVAPKSWARLTCVNLDSWKFYQATEDKFNEVDPLVITEKEINDARERNGSN